MNVTNDIFNEQLVKRALNTKSLMVRVGIVGGAITVLLLVSMILPMILLPAILVIGFIAWFLIKRTNLEFEYILTNYELDIVKIINKLKRKKGISIDVKKFSIVAPMIKKEYEADLSKFDKVLDYSSGVINENTYAAMYNKDGKRFKLIFEPNEKMLKSIRMYCPSAIKK